MIDGDTTSFKARLIAPMVQAKLQEKLDHDLARLRALLEGEAAAAERDAADAPRSRSCSPCCAPGAVRTPAS